MRRTALALAGLTAFGLAAAPAAAENYRFAFTGYFLNLKMAEAVGDLHWGEVRYRLAIRANARGLLDWFTEYAHESYSEGPRGPEPQVQRHRHRSSNGKEEKWLELAFDEGRARVVGAEPHPDAEDRPAIAPDLLRDAVDPLTAVLTAGLAMEAHDACDVRLPIYDGRRRYDMILEQGGRLDYGGPAGRLPALVCALRFERIGGYGEESKKWKPIAGKVYVQQVRPELPPLPVRLEVYTAYGTALIHMVRAAKAS